MICSKVEVTGIEDIKQRLGDFKNKAPTVLSRAINRAAENTRTNMGKETSGLYYISSTDVKKTVRIIRASRGSLKAEVLSQGSGIALSKFRVSPGTPVKYRKNGSRSPKVYKASVKRSEGLKPLDKDPKAFIAVMKSGHTGVFERLSGKSLPLKQLYGPSVPQMVKNESIMKKINSSASETLQKRIDTEVNNILRKG